MSTKTCKITLYSSRVCLPKWAAYQVLRALQKYIHLLQKFSSLSSLKLALVRWFGMAEQALRVAIVAVDLQRPFLLLRPLDRPPRNASIWPLNTYNADTDSVISVCDSILL